MSLLLFFNDVPAGATLYYVVGPSSGWSNPTAAEIKLGQLSGGGSATASGSTASPETTQTFDWPSSVSGLASGTAYRIAFVWSDGVSDSNVAVSDPITTTGAANDATGALSADAATASGTALRFRVYTATGALTAGSATASGSALRFRAFSATGALTADSATVSGTAAAVFAATGALAADSATVSGAALRFRGFLATGALSADAATVSGTAAHFTLHASTGALTADNATVSGSATHIVVHAATGALSADSAVLSGTAAHERAATGSLIAGDATVSGTAARTQQGTFEATGSLVAGDATLAGTAAHFTLHTATGDLSADSATVSGAAARLATHDASGALAADSATVSGVAFIGLEPPVEQTKRRGTGNRFVLARKRLPSAYLIDWLTNEEPSEETKRVIREIKAGRPLPERLDPPKVEKQITPEQLAAKLIPRRLINLSEVLPVEQTQLIRKAVRIAQERDDEDILMLL